MEKKNFPGKKRPAIGLSLFPSLSGSFSPEKNKSPSKFGNGVVGLGIVAAMTDWNNTHELFRTAKAIFPKSSPIPIVSSSAKASAYFIGGSNLEKNYHGGDDVDELSESYTCVISHVEHKLIKKQVYFDDDKLNMIDESIRSGIFSASPLKVGGGAANLHEFSVADFLSSCYLCSKHLHGRDIFMYRGEKAFCSTECRDKQIRSDDYREKCGSKKAMNYSVSPCSGPLLFSTGLVAA